MADKKGIHGGDPKDNAIRDPDLPVYFCNKCGWIGQNPIACDINPEGYWCGGCERYCPSVMGKGSEFMRTP